MASFSDLESAAPTIASFFRQRIEATGLSLVGTTRSDGGPTTSWTERGGVRERVRRGALGESEDL